MPLENPEEAHISFDLNKYDLKKHKARIYRKKDGWAEASEWRNAQDGPEVRVRVFANVNYEKVFMRSGIDPLEDVVREISGDGYVEFGRSKRIYTRDGFYEYQVFSASGLLCVLVQSYWADHSFSGIDVVRGTEASDTIMGNHMFQAYLCDAEKTSIESSDLSEFLFAIDLRDAYWPDHRFEAAN